MSTAKLTLMAGTSESFEADFQNENGTPMDLAGITVDLIDGQSVIPCTVTPVSSGTMLFSFSPEQTAAMRPSTKAFFRLTNGAEVKRRGPFWIAVQ